MTTTAMTDTSYAHEYASMILQRNRIPMPQSDFVPNWKDKPRPAKHYPGAVSFPLPDGPPADTPLSAGLGAHTEGAHGEGAHAGDEPFTLPALSTMLRDSYGLIGRRLAIQANTDVHGYPWYSRANWSRGTASGGGLYPCSIYWVAGPGAGVCPGVYHYSPRTHAMQRLLAGDVTPTVRAALGAPSDAAQFLVVGVKYWANAFKYNDFAYHAVSMDVGTVLQTWRLLSGGRHRIDPHFWFDQAALTRLIGLPADDEGLFAVVPLNWAGPVRNTPAAGDVAVRRQDQEKSKVVLRFDTVRRIHRTTAQAATRRPGPGALAAAAARPAPDGGDRIPLPPAEPLGMPVSVALQRRRSSFGRFDASVPMTTADLGNLLAATHAAHLPTEIGTGDDRLAKLYVFVNHVRGAPPGSYEYDPARHELRAVRPGPPGMFLQRNYFLPNYNLEQAAAVVVPAVRVRAVLDAAGPRGYNVVNATIGAVAQTFYTAASALDLGAGVALGFDGVSYLEELGLSGTDETPMLIMLAGRERPLVSDFRYELR